MNTRYQKREIADARQVLAQVATISQIRPNAIVTDGLRSYPDAINKEFFTLKNPRTQQVRIPNIRDKSSNNMVERFMEQSDKETRLCEA